MSKKKPPIWIFVLVGVVIVITALTIYVNKVVLPVQIKKIAITQAKNYLKRNVEIGNLRFNWVKGLIVEDIRIYQKDATDIFFQADRISMGIIFIPGFKEHTLTIPSVDVSNPKVNLIRRSVEEWNFSDLLQPPAPAAGEKPSNIKVNLLGVNITNGNVSIDDPTGSKAFHQDLDDVNVKVGLGATGINADARANLTKTDGSFNVQGTYQPLSKAFNGHVYLKNIRPGQYLSLIPPIPDVTISDALIKEVNIDTHYDENLFSIKGDISTANLNVKYGTMQISGDVEANINQCDIKKGSINVDASVLGKNAALILSPTESFKGTFSLEKVKVRQDKEGTQLVGTINVQTMDATYNGQTFRGDLLARPITIEMKNENDIDFKGDFKSNRLEIGLSDQQSISSKIHVDDAHIRLTNKKDLSFEGKVNLDEMELNIPNIHAIGSIGLNNLNLTFKDDTLNVKTAGELNNWQINLDKDKSVILETSFSVDAMYPLKTPEKMTYAGTFNVQHAELGGYPYGPFKEITANGTFKTDHISLKLFSFMAFDSAFKGAATIMNFKDPVISAEIANESIDLGKFKDFLPDIYNQYGLTTTGKASFNASFEGIASSPLSGKINVKAQLQGVDVESTTFKQKATNINGSIAGTPESLTWNDFSGIYLGKKYTLTGSLNNFQAPKISTSLNGDDIKLDVAVENKGNAWTINKLLGKYFDILFEGTGKVTLPANQAPLVDVQTKVKFDIEKALPLIPEEYRKLVEPYGLKGDIAIDAHVGGNVSDWKNLASNATIKSKQITVMGYHIDDITASINQNEGKIANTTIDATVYTGKAHTVLNMDLTDASMPFDIAFNIDALGLQELKKDIPALKGKDIKGKFYLTTVGKGKATDITNMTAKGSLAIREGFLTEFKIFEGLLGILNEAMRLGQLTITDVDGNFVIEKQKVTTENLRLISPTIVLLTQGWVDLNQMCDLNVTVDMSSGVIPPVAEQVLRTMSIHIYDKISAPKFDKKISVPQVLNSIIKTIGIFQ